MKHIRECETIFVNESIHFNKLELLLFFFYENKNLLQELPIVLFLQGERFNII